MKLSEDFTNGTQVINGYDDRSLIINEQTYTQSLIVSNFKLVKNWPIKSINELSNSLLEPILDLQPEVIIIGTGNKLTFPRPENYASVINKGIGIEFMDTGAACRTYNVLLSENRKVALGAILP